MLKTAFFEIVFKPFEKTKLGRNELKKKPIVVPKHKYL